MDCLFNKQIPESSEKRLIIRPTSKTFITGLSSSYDETYPSKLKDRITVEEWSSAMSKINESLFFNWPCLMVMSFGYCFSVCTLGLSLCVPGCRIKDAKKRLQCEIIEINKDFTKKGLTLKYMQKCSTSWLELTIEEIIALDTDNSQL